MEDIIRLNPLLIKSLKLIESYYKSHALCDQVNVAISYHEEGAIHITLAIVLSNV